MARHRTCPKAKAGLQCLCTGVRSETQDDNEKKRRREKERWAGINKEREIVKERDHRYGRRRQK